MRLEAPARPDPLHGGRTDIAGLRQPTTVLTATPHSAAILALATPSPASSRALDRTTSRCAAEVDLDNLCKVWRCPSDKASAGAGLFIAQSIARQAPIAIHYTSMPGRCRAGSPKAAFGVPPW